MNKRTACIVKMWPHKGLFDCYSTALTNIDYCLLHGYVPRYDFTHFIYQDETNKKDPWGTWFEMKELYEDPYEIEDQTELVLGYSECESDPSYELLIRISNKFIEDNETILKINNLTDYIKVRKEFIDIADDYVEKHFSGKKVTGVHIRHTDYFKTQLRFHYTKRDRGVFTFEEYVDIMKQDSADMFYIATDAHDNIQKMRFIKELKGRFLYNDFTRSMGTYPIHRKCIEYGLDPVKLGTEVILDTLILSRCDKLIGTCSNIPQTALFWNPSLPFVNIAQMVERQTL